MNRIQHLCVAAFLGCSPFLLSAQRSEKALDQPAPAELILEPWIIGAEVAAQWKGLLPTVNPPNLRRRAFPGQHLTIALGATGKDRDRLLRDSTYEFNVEFGGTTKSFKALRPTQTRRIKADGADFVQFALKELKVGGAELEEGLALVSLALFEVDWAVPVDAKDGIARIRGMVTSPLGQVSPMRESEVEVWSFDRVAREGAFKDQKESGDWMMTYYQHPEPSRLVHALTADKDNPAATQPNVIAFDVEVLKSSPAAAQDLMQRLKDSDRSTRGLVLLLLSEAGYDLTACLKTLPEEEQARFPRARAAASALPDPYDLTLNLADPYQITTRMDMLWSRFLATGEEKPVRAIAQVLAWREDWKVFIRKREDFKKTGKQANSLSPELLRALAYGAAGWSLGSFVRSHPLVADFVEAWKRDGEIPAVVREELGTLITNEAFKRQ